MDVRNRKLAEVLVNYSTQVKKGEKVWIDCFGDGPLHLLEEVVSAVVKAGGIPFYSILSSRVLRRMLENGNETTWKTLGRLDRPRMKAMDAYIGIRGEANIFQLAGVPQKNLDLYKKHYLLPVHFKERVEGTKWVVLRYPNPAFAQASVMSDDDFADFYFKVCTMDYKKFSKAMLPLKKLLEKTREVRLAGSGTDITIDVTGQKWIVCGGRNNIPDGEVFTSPVLKGVNGKIAYNTKTVYDGDMFGDIALEVEKGEIVKATCGIGNPKKLNAILNIDRGARYFGEFAFGLNPYIKKEILDILFDEKICGSNHLTPGNAYTECDNGNRSAVHWDLIAIGLDVYADGKLIRKGKKFIPKSLEGLNAGRF